MTTELEERKDVVKKTDDSAANNKGLQEAIDLARQNDIAGARHAIGLTDTFTDDEILDALIGIDKGIELFFNQRHVVALEYFQKAWPVIDASDDEDAKFIVRILGRFAEGLTALFSGNAHLAAELLNVNSEVIDRLCFFNPDFKLASYSYKSASLIALARAHINASDISAAEKVLGELRGVHDELLKNLDPDNAEHAPAFAEVFGTRLELVFLFILMTDLPTLDLEMWKKRIEMSRKDMELLKFYIEKCPAGPITILASQYPVIFTVLDTLRHSLQIAAIERKAFSKSEVEALINVDTLLLNSRHLIETCGTRGQGVLAQIAQLRRLQSNMLQIGRAATQDRGKFSGLISFVAFIVLIIAMHFTVAPTGYVGTLYYFGALILALIVGFGYGALKFQPMLKLFSQAIQKQEKK